MIKERKIPTILGFLILLLGLGTSVFLVQKGQVFFLRAAPEITPAQVKITNLTASSFSVSWLTEKETSGFVKFGETSSLEQKAADDRDQMTGATGLFFTHHVTLKNLKPKTRYFFKIGSQEKLFGNPYEVTTAGVTTGSSPPSDIASGTVLGSDAKPAEGTIVYLSLANMTPQSTLVRSGGTWLIPLNMAYSGDLSGFASYDKEAQVEEIFVQGGALGTATAMTTTKNDNPVPEIILGKTYDFRQGLPPETPTPTSTPIPAGQISPPSSGFSLPGITPTPGATKAAELTITNPAKEGEKVNAQKPEFSGTGPASKTIQILIESPETVTGTITVKPDGTWVWTPPQNLPPGEHKVTITYGNKTLSRTFTVLAAGTSQLPAMTATPSAQASPSPTLKPTPTATPSGRTGMPSTQAGVPSSGYLTPTFLVLIMGLILVFGGGVLKFLAHAR